MKRRTRRKRVNTAVEMAQIAALVLGLVMLIGFRDKISNNAGEFLNAFGPTEDLKVPAADMGSVDAQVDSAPKNSAK